MIKTVSPWLKVLTFFIMIFATWMAIRYAHQLPLDLYAFRQGQTALTAYWIVQNGFSFAYETPVGGAPWSIPFEFPIYQYLVVIIYELFGTSLEAAGRLTSFAFLLGCLYPAKVIVRKLELSPNVFFVFACLLLSSPLYLYWGRMFMIETTALFFALSSIPLFLDFYQKHIKWQWPSVFFFMLFSTLAMLQKSTTGFPVLTILGILWLFNQIKYTQKIIHIITARNIFLVLLAFVMPVLIGMLWVYYTDLLKAQNTLGTHLTSTELSTWNWGTLEQRFSPSVFKEIVWRRLVKENAGNTLGFFLFAYVLFSAHLPKLKKLIFLCMVFYALPIALFTNLHIIHPYYQAACLLFALAGLAIIIGEWIPEVSKKLFLIPLITVLFMGLNLYRFYQNYLPIMRIQHNIVQDRELRIAKIIQKAIPPTHGFIAYGFDWSSVLAYLAQRKSFTVPHFIKKFQGNKPWENPQDYFGNTPLSAIVVCFTGTEEPTLEQVNLRFKSDKIWRMETTDGCRILIRKQL
ncbi:MAG: hypothetical protein ACNA7Y_00125 [Gammaproteobacteria bacterium]